MNRMQRRAAARRARRQASVRDAAQSIASGADPDVTSELLDESSPEYTAEPPRTAPAWQRRLGNALIAAGALCAIAAAAVVLGATLAALMPSW